MYGSRCSRLLIKGLPRRVTQPLAMQRWTLWFSLQLRRIKDSTSSPSSLLLFSLSQIFSRQLFHFLLIHPSLRFSFAERRWVSVLCAPLFLLYLSISSRRPVTLSRDWGWLCSCNHCWYPCHWSSWLHSLLLTDQRCALLQVVCVCTLQYEYLHVCVCLSTDMWTLNFACAASIGQFIEPLGPFFSTGLVIS